MLQEEKRLLCELLQLYKENPALWDRRDVNYRKIDVRKQAYEILFEKFKKLYPDQGIKDLKRRLENMRASWSRERRKVEKSRRKGEKHTPSLWYYDAMAFIHPTSPGDSTTTDYADSENQFANCSMQVFEDNVEYLEPESDDEYEPAEKKPKLPVVSIPLVPLETDSNQHRKTDNDQDPLEKPMSSEATSWAESQAFGRTVGLQLQDLDRFQRTVAQKLISDVIFLARLKKLSHHSCISDA